MADKRKNLMGPLRGIDLTIHCILSYHWAPSHCSLIVLYLFETAHLVWQSGEQWRQLVVRSQSLDNECVRVQHPRLCVAHVHHHHTDTVLANTNCEITNSEKHKQLRSLIYYWYTLIISTTTTTLIRFSLIPTVKLPTLKNTNSYAH